MKHNLDIRKYEMPWRTNYELRSVIGWSLCLVLSIALINTTIDVPPEPFKWMFFISLAMVIKRTPAAYRLSYIQKCLRGKKLEFITIPKLNKKVDKNQENLWVGAGFTWESSHAQLAFELFRLDHHSLTNKESFLKYVIRKSKGKEKANEMGVRWIHGLGVYEEPLNIPLEHLEGHSLIGGTTGSGKSRMFDLFIAQAIIRNEAVIIIDPKGDKGLKNNAKAVCESLGEPERFVYFHPGFPEESIRIDPLRNFSRATELASRIAELIPSEAGADPFKSFGWQALNNIVQGLIITYERPSIVNLKRFLEGGAANLVYKAVEAYGESKLENYDDAISEYKGKMGGTNIKKKASMMMTFYENAIAPVHPSSDLEGLLSMFKHDSAHFGKMVASLLPIMNMLTSGELAELLSPDRTNLDDERSIYDTAKIINNGMVAYIGLDNLTDSMVGSAIGSLWLSDLTSVAGDRYNYGVDNRPVNVFIDEAAEVMNESFIQLLNKGRGANLRLYIATQTYADFTAKLGSKDQAIKVIGNINNTFMLRTIDTDTQTAFTDSIPKTRIKFLELMQGQNADTNDFLTHGGSAGEKLKDEETDLCVPGMLGMLPNLEYIAKVSGGQIIKGRLPILTLDDK